VEFFEGEPRRPANVFELSLSLRPVSSHAVRIIATLGFCESTPQPLLFRPGRLDMVSAKLDSAEFGICLAVIEVGRDECLVNVNQQRRREAGRIDLHDAGERNGMVLS